MMSLEASIFLVLFIISKKSIMSYIDYRRQDTRRGQIKYKVWSNYGMKSLGTVSSSLIVSQTK